MMSDHLYRYNVLEVIHVVDGDTYDVVISLGFGVRGSFRFRLNEVDTPEVYGRNASEAGQHARDFAQGWLASRRLHAETYKTSQATTGIGDGSFGRWAADFIDADTGERLSDALIEAGLGSRQSFETSVEMPREE